MWRMGAAHHPHKVEMDIGAHLLSFPQRAAETHRGRRRRRKREITGRGVQRGEIIPSSAAEQGAAARILLLLLFLPLLLRLFLGSSNVTAGGEDAEVLLRAG